MNLDDFLTYKIDPATIGEHIQAFIRALESSDPAAIYDGWPRLRDIIAPDYDVTALAPGSMQPAGLPWPAHVIIERSDLSDDLKDCLQTIRKIGRKGLWLFVEDKRQLLAMLRKCLDSLRPKESANDPRDKFCYDEMTKGKSLSTIKNRVNKKAKWESIYTEQGISQAAHRYAIRKRLSWPV